ncbi:TetR/AcrR family transcriptional regulator [Arsenicitalea aurantiaca]|uniref:TetR/AcrR family transcriptional regulator n=1 Tax=Arsenicitalea aurantiaca TaxID=1783274 RepID=A0A433XJZ0_9HYPH|nr:TetR-like C-terminal domain-containing protein [Arsenicitalea aurantiaca]RUT34400.1 TetR/AcrR family transcriptional regulator [Arsenicitalea aurantiaca]
MARQGLTREAVIIAAARLADAEGLDALSLANLAAALGVKSPSLYNHLGGLADLHQALALAGMREITARMTKAAVGRAGPDALLALGHAYRDFARQRPGLYAASLRAPEPDDREMIAAAEAAVETVTDALRAFGLEGEEALHATRGLRAIIHGFVALEFGGGFGLPLDLDRSFSTVLEIFSQGLTASAGRT